MTTAQKPVPMQTLNLGAGEDIHPEEWNVDIADLPGIDEVVDLNEYPWPYETDGWQTVRTQHVLEHLDDPIQAANEISRILKSGGTWELVYPIGHTRFEDPTHKHYWNWHTAETLIGDREHAHEHVNGFSLAARTVDWKTDSTLWEYYTELRLRYSEPGPWLGQIPTLCGEVQAVYHKT